MYVRMYACTYFSSSSFCICLQDRRHQISGSLRPKTCSPMSYVHCQAKVQKWPPRGKRLYVRKKPNLHPLFSQVLTMSRLRSTRGIDSASTYVCRYISQRAIDAAIIVVYLRMHVYSQTTYPTRCSYAGFKFGFGWIALHMTVLDGAWLYATRKNEHAEVTKRRKRRQRHCQTNRRLQAQCPKCLFVSNAFYRESPSWSKLDEIDQETRSLSHYLETGSHHFR